MTECTLQGNCLATNFVYKAQVTSPSDGMETTENLFSMKGTKRKQNFLNMSGS